MKKKSLLDLAVLATVFAIFLTSSFDLVGSIKVMGFTLRAVYLFVLIGAGLTLYRWIKQKELILPEGFLFLGIWIIMILVFIPNSPLVIRNVGYGAWLLLNVAIIFFVVNFMNRDNMEVFIRVYLVSFFAVSLLGIVQYITPQIGLPPFVVEQWWVPQVLPRVNAFTYEPSFFATYLLFGIPVMLILLARGNLAGIPKWLYYTMFIVDVTALILCSSRMGILLFLVFLAGFAVYVMVRWIRERKLGLHLAMSFAVPLVVTASVLLIMDMRARQVNKDVGYALYLRDTGWKQTDITKDNSLKNRMQRMKKTFEVFQKNPVIGVSLGGIAPWIATTRLTNISSNDEVKPFEGINVPLEVLAASGVIGFIVFCIYIFLLCRPLLKKWPHGADKDYYIALFWGFALGFIMLVENQNILRPYVWTHIALMVGVILVLGRQSQQKKKGTVMANCYRRFAELCGQVIDWHPRIPVTARLLLLIALCAVPSFAQTNITSVQNGNWNDPATWSTGSVPTSGDNVTVDAGHTVTVNNDANCNDIGVIGVLKFEGSTGRVLSSRHLYVHGTGRVEMDLNSVFHTLNATGDVTNDGTMYLSSNGGSAGINIEFDPVIDRRFSGSGVTDITSITVNCATSTATVLIEPDNLTVQGLSTNAPGFLNLVKGTAKLNVPLETVLFTTTSPTIATSSALWIDNPNLAVKPQNAGINVSGTLRISGGILNVGEDQDDCIIVAPGGTFITEGGAVNVSAAIGVASPSHAVKFTQTGGTITVQRFGNSSTTFAGFDLGTSSLTNATSTAGTIVVQHANTALTGPGDFRVPLGFNITGGTVQLGNATTTAQSTFRIRGAIPNLVIDQTFNHTVRLAGPATFVFPTTIPPGATLDLNGNGLSLRRDLDITAGATLNATTSASSLTFGGTSQQSYNNDGTLVDGYIRSIVVNNSSGATPAVSINDNVTVSNSLFLTYGSLEGSGTLTLGNALASTIITMTRVNGSMLNQPVFDPNVTFNATYNNALSPTLTGPELPSVVGVLTVNNTSGVLLNATTTATTLTLTNGILTTATSTPLTVAGTNPTNVTGGSSTSYVKGPLIRTLPASLAAGTEYSFPVGGESFAPVSLVDPTTDASGTVAVQAEVFDGHWGTDGNGFLRPFQGESSPEWIALLARILFPEGGTAAEGNQPEGAAPSLVPGTRQSVGASLAGNITSARVRFTNSSLGLGSRIGKSDTANGAYNSIGGTVSGNTLTSDPINSFSYFALGLSDNTRSGTYTVGSGGNYETITAAVADLDTSAISGPVTLSLLDAGYPSETIPIVIRQIAGVSATNTLTIKPAAGISPVITGDSFDFTGLIKLEGADFVTIDGSNNGTDSRDMTITCTGTYNPMIWLSSQGPGLGARNNTIKNLNLSGGLSQVSTNTGPHAIIGSGSTPISDGADNDSNKVHNNLITKVRYGVVFRGVSGNPNEGNSVTNNDIGAPSFGADQIGKVGIGAMHQSGITISGNSIRSLGSIYPNIPDGAGDDRVGIALGRDEWPPIGTTAISNAVVTGNVIQDIVEESAHSAVGILVAATGNATNNTIANNMISGVRANGTSGEYAAGIGYHSGQGDKIVFNSIRMEGDADPSTSTTATGSISGIRVNGGSNLTVKNNIISADITSNTGTLNHYAIAVSSSYNWGTGGLNYNDYYVDTSNAQMKIGGIGFSTPYTSYTDLTAWKTNFSAAQDANSKSFAPDFTSATDLHLNVGASNTDYAGTPIAGVVTDYDGETRSTGFPYIGADEVTTFPLILPPQPPALAFPADNATGQPTSISPKWNPSAGATGYQFQLSLSALFETTLVSDSTLTDTTTSVSSLANNTEYFWRVLAHNSAGASPYSTVFSFTTIALPPAAPTNLAATPGNHQASLMWSRNSEQNIMRYRIFAGTSPNPTTAVDSTVGGVNDTSKVVAGLVNDTTHYFRVTAVDSSFLESAYSNEVSATPVAPAAPLAPAALTVTDSSSRTITIKWRKNGEPDFLRYRVYRGTSPGPTTKVDSTTAGAGDTSKTFTGLTNGTRYYLRVTAVDTAGNESGYSNEVNTAPADRTAPMAPQNLIVADSSSLQIGLKWARNAEADFFQYVIYQGTSQNPTNAVDTTSGGAADTSTTISGLTNGTRYYFRVSALDSAGNQSPYSNEVNAAPNAPTSIEDLLSQIPVEFSVSQNYPNPFNPATVIRYGLPERSSVKIEIYDLLGRRVTLLVDEEQEARYYEVFWNAQVPSGIYFYRIHAVAVGNPQRMLNQVRKMILLK